MDRLRKCKVLVIFFCENSSCHGLAHTVRKQHKAMQILWILIVLLATALFLWQFVFIMERYFAKAMVINTKVRRYKMDGLK